MMFPNPKIKLAMLISGGGTTMEAILLACRNGKLSNVEPVLVISSNKKVGGLERAKNAGMSVENIIVINPRDWENKEEFGKKIISECEKRGVNSIGQYGWMIKTPDNVVKKFEGRIINQHPGPLDNGRPDFGGPGMYGMRVIQARLDFVRKTGHDFWTEATAHLVTSEFDKGAILRRKQVEIFPNETPESLQKKLLPVEHEVQIETLHDFSEGHVVSFFREKPLIEKDEEEILEKCKETAKKVYPNG